MTLRRYAPIKPSRGTVIRPAMRVDVFARDGGCIGIGRLPGPCAGGLEPDHVRASHGTGMKSVTCPCNLVSVCGSHHRYKTEHGKVVRDIFLDYLARFGYTPHGPEHEAGRLTDDCGHVDPRWDCDTCQSRRTA